MAICERNLRMQLSFQIRFPSPEFRFAQWSRKALKAFFPPLFAWI